MSISNRRVDVGQEEIVNLYLLKNFFRNWGFDYSPISDYSLQVQGVDFLVTDKNGDIHYMDAKAQTGKRYLGNPTNTYILEIVANSSNLENVKMGWFINNELLITDYIFCWINKAKLNDRGYLDYPTDIKEVEVMVVPKKAIKEKIEKTITFEYLLKNALEMCQSGESRRQVAKWCHLTYSERLNERPVNLVVDKSVLKELSTYHCLVKPDKIEQFAEEEKGEGVE